MSNASSALPLAKRRSSPGKRRPNYVLLSVGLFLLVIEVGIALLAPLRGAAHALLVALSITITLYGLFPVNLITGEFGGLVGRLVVAGPAAMGLFVFLVMLRLGDDDPAPTPDEMVVMLATSNRDLSERAFGGTQVRLLDVDSFSDDELTPVLKQLRTTVVNSGVVPTRLEDAEQRRIALSMLELARLRPPYDDRAAALIEDYFHGSKDVDERWEEMTKEMKEAAKTSREVKASLDRLKKQPFALFTVGGETRLQVVTELTPLKVDGLRLDVPVIANPARKVNPRLEEAVVVKTSPVQLLRRSGA